MKNKMLVLLFISIFLIGLVSAETQSLGIFKKDTTVVLIQSCYGSTYANITRVIYPDSSFALDGQYAMTQAGYDYSYSFINANYTGQYLVYGTCDENAVGTSWGYDFKITNNGNEDPEGITIVFFSLIFIIIMSFLVYMLLYSLGHFMRLDFDMIDMAFNLGIYFALITFYMLSNYYLGNADINNFLIFIIEIGAFTTVLVPLFAFVFSIIVGGIFNKRQNFGQPPQIRMRRKLQ